MDEQKYLDLLADILENGKDRPDRTGTGTLSVFGRQLRFDISPNTCPIITTKRVPWKQCIEELLWFLRGDTNSKILEEKGVNIWKGNSSREFLDNRNLKNLREGDIGAGYGFQWRHFGANYTGCHIDYEGQGIDQLQNIIDTLKTNPFDRRIILNAWNPQALNKMALPPCHCFAQFYVENGKDGRKKLSCHMYQRSVDTFLGFPWNIMSYSVLTKILALKCDMDPEELVISTGDTHIYKTHIKQVETQLQRKPASRFPQLILRDRIKDTDFSDLTLEDFELIGYKPLEGIKGVMAI
jgi:thymidylate synthase